MHTHTHTNTHTSTHAHTFAHTFLQATELSNDFHLIIIVHSDTIKFGGLTIFSFKINEYIQETNNTTTLR